MRRIRNKPGNPEDIRVREAARLLEVNRGIVYRLFHAGYIVGRRPSPRVLFLSRSSVLAHKKRTADPEFWERHPAPW